MQQYFDTLNISSEATIKDIKKSYKQLSKKYHPDLNNNSKESHLKFLEIKEAYEKLLSLSPNNSVQIRNNDLLFKDFLYKNFDSLKIGNNIPEHLRKHIFSYAYITIEDYLNGTTISFQHNQKTFSLKIPSYTSNGEIIQFNNVCDNCSLFLKIIIKDTHRNIIIKNNDLFIYKKISIFQYIYNYKGFSLNILNSKYTIKPSLFFKKNYLLKNKGFVDINKTNKGNIYIKLNFSLF